MLMCPTQSCLGLALGRRPRAAPKTGERSARHVRRRLAQCRRERDPKLISPTYAASINGCAENETLLTNPRPRKERSLWLPTLHCSSSPTKESATSKIPPSERPPPKT